LIDVATGERVNEAGSSHIGEHVWIGLGVIVNKGASIADDNVVAASSFVNCSFQDSQTVIAGTPAKVVREGVP
jgi:acetyltransferase-like isoleucine patch superfamily enzyme